MGREYGAFVDSIESENTAKIAKAMSHIGEHDYDCVTPPMIDAVVLDMKPKSMKDITTTLYIMSLYAVHLGNRDMEYIVRGADRKLLWRIAKPNAPKKFISHTEFEDIYDSILKHEEHNAVYYASLFASVYYGIYSDDLGALKNLRASDIDGASVHVGDRVINVPIELSRNLLSLADSNIWWRNNRYGAYKICTKGLYEDSCFKVENRDGTTEYTYRYSYYRMLRKIAKEYIGRGLTPLQLYVSGIMFRLSERLGDIGVTLEDAFSDNNKDRSISRAIRDELEYSGYDIEVRNFREMVKGHIDSFSYGK